MNDYITTGLLALGLVAGYLALVLLLGRFCGVNDLEDENELDS